MSDWDSDIRFGSDDPELEAVLQMSREEAVAGSSRTSDAPAAGSSYLRKQIVTGQLSKIEEEISSIDDDITKLKAARSLLIRDRERILKELKGTQSAPVLSDRKGKGKATGGIDYQGGKFDWDEVLKVRMKKVFGIDNLRLCQRGVCNANMDGRDIVCVMPTGGGKSLTYQLPAILAAGCTIVISPLIALMTDQILHLREAGIEAVMLNGSTSKEDTRDITRRLMACADGTLLRDQKEIKLCYVTPEKIAQNKAFTSLLERLASGGKLARIVIDEAHCVSQLGHDFRPDYKKLTVLRQLVPHVPILALSATCPPRVLEDLLKILRMKAVVDGHSAAVDGTVYFSAPLYRKNLRYTILPKPANATEALAVMRDYILEHHENDSGIIYCLSKKDTETVAKYLAEHSHGKIKTGVYNSEIDDSLKERLHKQWRKGHVNVVCATIAFGLGIDKGNVRFVLHHTISKSIDGFYQESGRAGRDGQAADCVLYFRPQDASRLSGLVFGSGDEGTKKLHDMLRFAQDLNECRKLQFAKYFSASSHLAISSWTTDESDALQRCGNCDNCTRPPETIDRRDVTVEAWQVLKIMGAVDSMGGRVTLGKLADIVRGTGGGALDVGGKARKGKSKEKAHLNVEEIAGGKVALSKLDAETLVLELLLAGFLKESYSNTAYATNVYVTLGTQAIRFTRHSRDDVERKAPKFQCAFLKLKSKQKTKGATAKRKGTKDKPTGSKRKRTAIASSDEDDEDDEDAVEDDGIPDSEEDFTEQINAVEDVAEESDGGGNPSSDQWGYRMRPKKKSRPHQDMEVLELSSD